jgi:GT2 family glycosyltransferase/lipopolysaccharide/colanic/teichoic acid biosynthesis glycosyltransferase
MQNVDISIVIVNYNVKAFLEQCLMAIDRATHDLAVETFVVDNASVDGSQTMVKKRFPQVQLIENRVNVGFSTANNQALRKARGTYVLILNPDTLIQEDTLIILKNYLDRHEEVGAVGCKLINPDGSFQITSRRSLPTPWIAFTRIVGLSKIFPKSRLFGRYNMTYLDPNIETEVDVLPGSLMFIRREILETIGYFDETFFMYGEDVDLCYRITKQNWKIMYVPETKAIHYKGESTKKSEFSFVSNFYTAMLIFANKHFKHRYSIFLRMLLVMGIYGRAFFSYLWRVIKNVISTTIDLVLIIFSIFAAIKIWLPHYALERFSVVYPIFVLVWFIALYLFGVYHKKGRFRLKPVLYSTVVGLLVNSTFVYFFKQFAYSRVVVLISFVLIVVTLSLWRTIYRLAGPLAKKGPISKLRRAIIIGAGKEGKRILKQLQNRPDMHYEVCGFVDFDQKSIGKTIDGIEVLATIDNVRDVVRIEKINDVIFSSDRLTNAQILETIILAQRSGVNFRIVPHELEYIVAKSSVDEIDTVQMLDFSGVADPLDLIVKRFFDIVCALIMIVVTLPVVLFNLILGGRLTRRVVAGYMGKPISIYLFRGGIPFLRSTPLYYAVFIGMLSIVGSEISEYDPKDYRAIYKPGLTGLVQIKAREKKKALTQQEKDYYNLYYVKNQSVITDIQILLKSIF